MSKTTNKFSAEVRERAVRMVFDNPGQHGSRWQAIASVAAKSLATMLVNCVNLRSYGSPSTFRMTQGTVKPWTAVDSSMTRATIAQSRSSFRKST